MLIRIQEVSLLIRIYITSCSTVGHCYFQKYSKFPLILNLLIVLLAYSDSALCRVYRVPAFHWFYCFFFPVQPSCSTAQLVQNFPPNIGILYSTVYTYHYMTIFPFLHLHAVSVLSSGGWTLTGTVNCV